MYFKRPFSYLNKCHKMLKNKLKLGDLSLKRQKIKFSISLNPLEASEYIIEKIITAMSSNYPVLKKKIMFCK